MEKIINQRCIVFTGPGKTDAATRGSRRLKVPFDLDIGEDVTVSIKEFHTVYNVVKAEDFDNQSDSVNVVYLLKHLGE